MVRFFLTLQFAWSSLKHFCISTGLKLQFWFLIKTRKTRSLSFDLEITKRFFKKTGFFLFFMYLFLEKVLKYFYTASTNLSAECSNFKFLITLCDNAYCFLEQKLSIHLHYLRQIRFYWKYSIWFIQVAPYSYDQQDKLSWWAKLFAKISRKTLSSKKYDNREITDFEGEN